MPLFDTYVMVDWSASSRRAPAKPKEAAIWWAAHPLRSDAAPGFRALDTEKQRDGHTCVFYRDGGVQIYERTRAGAIESIRKFLVHETENDRRVLVGFDFAFGYPEGFFPTLREADVIEEPTARAFWNWVSEAVTENDKTNANNRFEVAGRLNRALRSGPTDHGPFWGHPKSSRFPGLTWYNPYAQERGRDWSFGFPKHRMTERRAMGATPSTLWQLYWGPSVVGSQALMGLHHVHHLRSRLEHLESAVVWPFDEGMQCPVVEASESHPRIVIAEIYPSLLKKYYRGEPGVTDSAQVSVNARAFAHLDQHHSTLFRSLFQGPDDLTEPERRIVMDEEGWILGVGFETEISNALDGAWQSERAIE